MKIALVRCPCIQPFPPDIGMGYLASSIIQTGNRVYIFDLNIELFNSSTQDKQKRWNASNYPKLLQLANELLELNPNLLAECARRILQTGARIIGFSIWETNKIFSLKLAETIKQLDKNAVIIFGGPQCYPLCSGNTFIKEPFVDIVVYGEGEIPFREIIYSLINSEKNKYISGCLLKFDGKIVDTGFGQIVMNLDELPFPDYRNFPFELYPEKNRLFLSFNRGCIGSCAYCSISGTHTFRGRSAISIYEEMKSQMQRHPGVTNFFIASAALNCDLRQLSQLCDFIIDDKLNISWGGNALIRQDMDYELVRKMAQAGCSSLVFGMESGSQRVLDKMGKRFSIEDSERLFLNVHKADIDCCVNFIVGFPGEQEEDFEKTLEFIRRNKQYINLIGSYAPCWIEPYSYLYQNPQKYSIIFDNAERQINFREWYSYDRRNTLEVREGRRKTMEEFVSSLGLRFAKKGV